MSVMGVNPDVTRTCSLSQFDPEATLTVTNENALEGGLLASIQERV